MTKRQAPPRLTRFARALPRNGVAFPATCSAQEKAAGSVRTTAAEEESNHFGGYGFWQTSRMSWKRAQSEAVYSFHSWKGRMTYRGRYDRLLVRAWWLQRMIWYRRTRS
jgi:hypothetical protein